MTPQLSPDAGPPGLFIAFEGGDGAGKSTQAKLLAEVLQRSGHEVVLTREPGGTPVGEQLRELVLSHGQGEIDARTEALIFAAARAAHVAQLIQPALSRGAMVISDRYIDSSAAYQGAGRGLGSTEIEQLNTWATQKLRPTLTVLLDVNPEQARARRAGQVPDRMEAEPESFHSQIRSAFLALAEQRPAEYLVLDALRPAAELHAEILQHPVLQRALDGVPSGAADRGKTP